MNNTSTNKRANTNPSATNVIQINNSNTQGGGLATASVVLGIIALVIAFGGFVPCLGTVAVFLAVPFALIGILLACFAAKKVAGLVIGGIALCVAVVAGLCQGALVGAAAAGSAEAAEEFNREMKKLEEDIKKTQRAY